MGENFDDAETLVLGAHLAEGDAPEEEGKVDDGLLDLLGDASAEATESADTVPGAIPGESVLDMAEEATPEPTSSDAVVTAASAAAAIAAAAAAATAAAVPEATGVKRAATQTLDLNLDVMDTDMQAGPVSDEHTGVLSSVNFATATDIVLKCDCLSVGRDESNFATLTDPRVSSEQFRVHRKTVGAAGPPWSYELEDCSRNGTLVNKKLVRGVRIALKDQDLVEVLPASKVGQAAAIAFLFHSPDADVPEGPAKKKIRLEGDSASGRGGDEAIFDGAMCAICQEVMHRPTSVQPCMHSFCSSCLGGWLKRPGDRIPRCPICRQGVAGVGKNHALDSMIEGLLKAHPDRQRSIATISDLDSRDPLHDCGYDLLKLRGPGDVAAGMARMVVAAAAAAEAMDAEDSEDHSEHEHESYSEEEEEAHAWTAPGALRPACIHCGVPAWQPLRAAVDLSTSSPVPATALMKSALASNAFEQEILQEWLHSKGLSLQQAMQSVLENPNPEGVSAVEVRSAPVPGGGPGALVHLPVGAWTELAMCQPCSQLVLRSVVYSIRERIQNEDLPERARGRRNCWYGHSCRTQSHKRAHAERLNHICAQTRFH